MNKLFLVGDSTVCYYDLANEDLDFVYPRNGYGMWLQNRLKGVEVVNLALSGRSSKSFLQESFYKKLMGEIGEGDFLSISFGHNDEKFKDVLRWTFGGGEINDERSFKYSLYTNYVKPALSVGAKPILCTPIVRRSETNDYVGDRVHKLGEVECDGIKFPPSDYPQSIRELAKELKLSLIDMTELTKEFYCSLSPEKTAQLHATLSKNLCDVDNTHLNSFGAHVIANLYIDGLQKTDSELKKFIVSEREKPTENEIITRKF